MRRMRRMRRIQRIQRMRLIGAWPERFRRSTRLKNLGVRPQIKDEADLQVRDVEVVIKSTPAAA